ncbi:hypothetical protein JCM6882_003420 [Rhodosporidiobolus microsporus]
MPALPSSVQDHRNYSRSSHEPPPSRSSSTRLDSFNPPAGTPQPARQVRWGTDEVYSQTQHAGGAESQRDANDGGQSDDGEAGHGGRGEGNSLAICATKGRVGCCYYDVEMNKLRFVEDQQDTSGWDLTTLILEQLLPSTVLTSANADADFVISLEQTLSTLPLSTSSASSATATSAAAGGEDADESPVRVEYRPQREFYAGNGRVALSQLEVTEGGWYADGGDADDEDDEGYASGYHQQQQQQHRATELFSGLDALGVAEAAGGEDEEHRDAYDFGRRRKRRRLGRGGEEGERAQRNRELRLEGFLNGLVGSPITLGCAGALLAFVSRSRSSAGELDGDEFEVAGLELLKLDKVMQINADALTSLQIFADESHASTHSSKVKEGLSLFGIVNLARTPLGRTLMRQWFLRPSFELDVIERRQVAVECFLRSENQHVVDAIQSNFKHVKNIPRVLRTLAGGRGGLKEWQTIWQFLYGVIMIRDAAYNLVHRKEVEVVEKVLTCFDTLAFKEVGTMITDIIDWEESSLQKGRICVRSGVDADLDEWKRQMNGLPSLLSQIAARISQELPPTLGVQELSAVYFPQLGFLLTIPYEPDVVDAGKYGAVGWDFQFITESRAYFKSDKCYDLDKHIGDVSSFITDKEIEIVHALLATLLRLSPDLLRATEAISELDCLIAIAETSRLYGWNRPTVVAEPVCEIVEGRHPLAELCVEAFVKNGTSLVGGRGDPASPFASESSMTVKAEDEEEKPETDEGKDKASSMIVVTGANFSGKSIYLKQVALIVFLAHIGCFVPAESATIGLTDRILTRVSTRESVTRGSSAFMIDLQQVSFILRNLTPSSLLLLDEFGKGTESNDGAGLFCGVLEWIVGLGKEMVRRKTRLSVPHACVLRIRSSTAEDDCRDALPA